MIAIKRGSRLTRDQKQIVSAHYLNVDDWMLAEDLGSYLKLISKDSKQIKIIDKRRKAR